MLQGARREVRLPDLRLDLKRRAVYVLPTGLPTYLPIFLSSFLTCFTCEHYAKLSPLIHFIISRLSMGLIDDNLPGYFPYQLLLRFRQCSGQKADQNGRTGEAPWAKAPTLARA